MREGFLCVGDLDVDVIANLTDFPSSDQKVAGHWVGKEVGGMAANVAVGLSRLGTDARLVAAVGDDDFGRFALARMQAENVDTRFVVARPNGQTFVCLILHTEHGERALVRLQTDAYLPRADEIGLDAFDGVRHVHATFGNADLAHRVVDLARRAAVTTSIDLEAADIPDDPTALLALLPKLDWLFMNRAARRQLLDLGGHAVIEGIPRVVTTLGSDGSCIHVNGGMISAGSRDVDVADTTGAGDGFVAAMLHGALVDHLPPFECLARANAAAAAVVTASGAQTGLPTARELAAMTRARPDHA
ncbi:MAG: carbohydrate kinase family protein [Pseudomonadota bacterium]